MGVPCRPRPDGRGYYLPALRACWNPLLSSNSLRRDRHSIARLPELFWPHPDLIKHGEHAIVQQAVGGDNAAIV